MPANTVTVRDDIDFIHLREQVPDHWVDHGLNARKLAPGTTKSRLLIRRPDGALQKWTFTPDAYYSAYGGKVIIRGEIYSPIPAI
jgi:hypothetical protein